MVTIIGTYDVEIISTTVEGIKHIQSAANSPYLVWYIQDSVVVSPNKDAVIVIGGENETSSGRYQCHHVQMYEVTSGKWRNDPLPSLIHGRKRASSFIFDQTVYTVAGGECEEKEGLLSSMECLDLTNVISGWQTCGPDLPDPIEEAASCVLDQWVWLSGGWNSSSQRVKSLYQ